MLTQHLRFVYHEIKAAGSEASLNGLLETYAIPGLIHKSDGKAGDVVVDTCKAVNQAMECRWARR